MEPGMPTISRRGGETGQHGRPDVSESTYFCAQLEDQTRHGETELGCCGCDGDRVTRRPHPQVADDLWFETHRVSRLNGVRVEGEGPDIEPTQVCEDPVG